MSQFPNQMFLPSGAMPTFGQGMSMAPSPFPICTPMNDGQVLGLMAAFILATRPGGEDEDPVEVSVRLAAITLAEAEVSGRPLMMALIKQKTAERWPAESQPDPVFGSVKP
jgi:hypothetical protein